MCKILYYYTVLDGSLDKLATTLTYSPALDENGKEDELFGKKLIHMKKVKLMNSFLNH